MFPHDAADAAWPIRPLQHLWSPEGLDERDHIITSAPDSNKIYLRVVRPVGDATLPCVYWVHGGGMAQGSAYDQRTIPRARMLAHMGVVVVAVDFRNCSQPPSAASLPPGHGTSEIAPFPAGLNDCYSGLEYVHAHAAEFGVNTAEVVVAGPSGGGNLTIAVRGTSPMLGRRKPISCRLLYRLDGSSLIKKSLQESDFAPHG